MLHSTGCTCMYKNKVNTEQDMQSRYEARIKKKIIHFRFVAWHRATHGDRYAVRQ